MKSLIVKKIREEFGVKKISGKKLELYNFYELVGFYFFPSTHTFIKSY